METVHGVIATPWTAAAWRRFGFTRLIRERHLESLQRHLLRPVQPKRGHVPAVQINPFLTVGSVECGTVE